MPALLCPSPVLLDQSFPRGSDELQLVAIALGELVSLWNEGTINILLTTTLQDFIQDMDLSRLDESTGVFREIYVLLNQWFLSPRSGLVCLDVSNIQDYAPHPTPNYCTEIGLVEIWADEIGRVLAAHDKCCDPNTYFIGIACHLQFSSQEGGNYKDYCSERAFPLIGSSGISNLKDSYGWKVSNDLHQREVSFETARRNCVALGGKCTKPRGGSHYKISFESGPRPWMLDPNVDPVPLRFLKQLESITGYPFEVAKTVLLEGEFPERRLRFERVPEIYILSA